MIEAKIVLDSAHPQGDDYRLTTFLLRYPKFIHAEHCRHRMMSLCVSSSRAVPVSKNLEEVRSDELRAGPVYWASEQKGMSGGEELDDTIRGWSNEPNDPTRLIAAKERWKQAALRAAFGAEDLTRLGVHKSIVNRLLEPFLHVNVLCTVVAKPGLMNFFGLRLDRAAQPEIRALAEAMWAVWNESRPKPLQPGHDWHLPFVSLEEDRDEVYAASANIPDFIDHLDTVRKVSAARCARLSYTSFETGKRSTIKEDLALYDRLITSRPIHASPAEHQATSDRWVESWQDNYNNGWVRPELHGNLPGWIQHRKLLPNEACADLPEGYTL